MPTPKYNYKHGDYNVIDDRSGFKVKASETRREWTGSRVRASDWEARHPQDFVRAKGDIQRVPDPRPGATDKSTETATTLSADEATGQTVLSVTATGGFEVGDPIVIHLDTNETHLSTIASFDASTVTISTPIPSKASSGNAVSVFTNRVTL